MPMISLVYSYFFDFIGYLTILFFEPKLKYHNLNILENISLIMLDKRILFILFLLILIGGASSVSADDSNSTDLMSHANETVSGDVSDELVGDEILASDNTDSALKSGENNEIYFDASASRDGDGSQANPYKYLQAGRITSGVTAHFAGGEYELNDSCMIEDAKLIGDTNVQFFSKVSNQYDFIIKQNSVVELSRISFYSFNILNQGTLIANDVYFEGNDVFDLNEDVEMPQGSGLVDSSFGGVILCDAPGNARTRLVINGCTFREIHGAGSGGVIAAVNCDVKITNGIFMQYSANYMGGAIYCLDCDLVIVNIKFTPYTLSANNTFTTNRGNTFNPYTAYYGGSIYCENSDVVVNRSNFIGSVAYSFGGCVASLQSTIKMRDNYFNESLSLTDGGGAIYNSNGELYIVNCKLYNNSAQFGGAICNLNSILDSYRCWYVFNSANFYGGVIYDIYGSMNLRTNLFGDSRAQIGGTIYTRIPNVFNLYSNSIATSFAKGGSTIFFDGKKESMYSTFNSSQYAINYDDLMIPLDSSGIVESNSFSHTYSVFAELTGTLNGEEYSIISNPIYYVISMGDDDFKIYPWGTYWVNDGNVSMMIQDADEQGQIEVISGNIIRNVIAQINFTRQLTNPVLKFHLLKGRNIFLYNYFGPEASNMYWRSENLFSGYEYELIESYSVDLSDRIHGSSANGECSFDFSNPFLNIQFDNLYEAGSYYPVSLINSSFFDSSLLPDWDVLSSYYNSNDYGFVSSVKNQGGGDNCWAFAGLATLETCLKKATGVSFDFSEENAKNLMAAYSVFGLKLETNYGGYDSMLMSYLTSWLGPIDETLEDYDDYSSISVQANPMFHIQNIKFLPVRQNSLDNDLYKLAIRDYGAVSVTFKLSPKEYHAVSLVGWDDNYRGKDSLGNDADGAWIFKNSWGADWENGGFGYLSYQQELSEQLSQDMHAYTFMFDDVNPYTKIHQYDYGGVSEFYHYSDIYFKNVFSADNDCLLSAFSTYFDRQTNYTVTVIVNNQQVHSQEGISAAGYYTIPFSDFIQLDKGDVFEILIHNHNVGLDCIPVCSADEITKKTFNSNVSFISEDGENWFDLYDYAGACHVACIKAFTQNINLTDIKISIDEFKSVSTKNINVKVHFDEFEGIDSINYCLVKFIVDGNVHYAQIKDGFAYLNLNLDDGSHSLSAQYKDNLFESNVVQFTFTVKSNSNANSFNGLQDLINSASDNSVISLNRDYSYDENLDDGQYGIHINKTLTINGKGHIIDGLHNAAAAYISADNVILNDIVFANFHSSNGGALYVAARNVTLNNCIFTDCRADQYGGAVYSLFDINISGCRFINNSAVIGGGVYLMNSATSSIRNCLFENNSALHASSLSISGVGTCRVSSTNFTNNNAAEYGGAVMSSTRQSYFEDCQFSDNFAKYGGSIFSNSRSIEFLRCKFTKNTAEDVGGAIIAYNNVRVSDSEFVENSVLDYVSYMFKGYGGAIYSFDTLNVYDSIFINNSAIASGGAIGAVNYLNVYKSFFINNSAQQTAGAIYSTGSEVMKSDIMGSMFVLSFAKAFIYDSEFIENFADFGGAIDGGVLVRNSTFIANAAEKSGGAIYDVERVEMSRFINNTANYGGAIYSSTYSSIGVYDSHFINNSAHAGGAISLKKTYSTDSACIVGSTFSNNFADYGGAISSDVEEIQVNISSCKFTDNRANVTAAAIYAEGELAVGDCEFRNGSAVYGGAIYIHSGGSVVHSIFINNSADYGGAIYIIADCLIENSRFDDNSAIFGGAIFSYSEDEFALANVNVFSSNFTNNHANRSGGAIYSDCRCVVSDSNFIYNSANWGGAIYALAYFDLKDSVIRSNNETPVYFTHHHYDDGTYYGDLYLENNQIEAKNAAIFFNSDENPSDMPLYMAFNNTSALKGSTVSISLEDGDGNSVLAYAMKDLELTLTNPNNNVYKVKLTYDRDLGGYIMDTSSLRDGKYRISAKLSNNPGNFVLKQENLELYDASGKASSDIISAGLSKDWTKSTPLSITLRDTFGNPIAGEYVSVNLAGKTIRMKTDSKGHISIPVNLAPKGYTATVSYLGGAKYFSTSTKLKVTVKKISSKITAKKLTLKVKKVKKYSIVLKNSKGKAISKAKVTIKVAGKKFKAKTNSKGKATFKLKLTKKGSFKATIKYGGNAYCNAASKKVSIKVKK